MEDLTIKYYKYILDYICNIVFSPGAIAAMIILSIFIAIIILSKDLNFAEKIKNKNLFIKIISDFLIAYIISLLIISTLIFYLLERETTTHNKNIIKNIIKEKPTPRFIEYDNPFLLKEVTDSKNINKQQFNLFLKRLTKKNKRKLTYIDFLFLINADID